MFSSLVTLSSFLRVPRSLRICEVVNTQKRYPWEITSDDDGIYYDYTYTSFRDVYHVYGIFNKPPVSSLELYFNVNGAYDMGHSLESPEQRSKSMMRCVSVIFALVDIVFSSQDISKITFSAYGRDEKLFRLYDMIARAFARKYHGVYNQDPNQYTCTIYLKRVRRRRGRHTRRERSRGE